MTLKNTGITHPVLIDVVSGQIKTLKWKQGSTDTLEALPVRDSVMAIADESYFDWPVLPEAPSSLNVTASGSAARLSWEVHGGAATGIVVERRNDGKGSTPSWDKVDQLSASATTYTDVSYRAGQSVSYRVKAVNDAGTSAYSNIVRLSAVR